MTKKKSASSLISELKRKTRKAYSSEDKKGKENIDGLEFTKETTVNTLKWLHIAISNAKRTLLGIHHKIKGKYLQNYLNVFCYKLNRRYFGDKLFDRLLVAVTQEMGYKNG